MSPEAGALIEIARILDQISMTLAFIPVGIGLVAAVLIFKK